MKISFKIYFFIVLTFAVSEVRASTYSNSSFAGGRATAMGGARAALSNDASAAFENPAGLVYSRAGYQFNSSVQGQGGRSIKYECEGQESVKTRADDLNGFIGFSKDIINADTRFAFGIFTPSGQSNHQEIELHDMKELNFKRLIVQTKSDSQSVLYGVALATKVTQDFSFGARLGISKTNSSGQYYQNVVLKQQKSELPKEITTSKDVYLNMTQGVGTITSAYQGVVGAGVQYKVSDALTLGAFAQTVGVLRSRMQSFSEMSSQYLFDDDSPLTKDDVSDLNYTKVFRSRYDATASTRATRMPILAVVGSALKLNPEMLLALDLSYATPEYFEDTTAHMRDVTNVALGFEHVLPEQLYYRLGARTNFDHEFYHESEGRGDVGRNQLDTYAVNWGVGRGTFSNGAEVLGGYAFGKGRNVIVNRDGVGPVYKSTYSSWFVGVAFNNDLKVD